MGNIVLGAVDVRAALDLHDGLTRGPFISETALAPAAAALISASLVAGVIFGGIAGRC